MKNKPKYTEYAKKTLKVMSIQYVESESLDSLLTKLRNTIQFPASDTERQIRLLSEEIAQKVEASGDEKEIEELIKKLEFEVSYLPFD